MVMQALAVGQVVSWIGTGPEAALGIGKRLADYVAWKKSVEIGKVDLPLDVSSYVHGVVSGFMNPVRVKENLKFHGYDADIYNDGFFQFTNQQFNNDDSMLGLQISVAPGFGIEGAKSMNFLVWDTARALEGDDILTLLNRQNITEDTARFMLQKQGVRDAGCMETLLSLRNEIPPVADLIRFAVRDAFFPDVIAAYGEADEYPTYIDKFIRWQGLGWETGQQAPASKDIDGQPVAQHPATWGEISWWAHWEFPSATQGYDMMFKLYEQSDYGPSPYIVGPNGAVDKSLVFDENDLNRLLRASAYSTYWRQKLAVIASQPINKGDLVRMLKQGLVDESTVYHTYRAQNYDDRTAKIYTQYTLNQQKPDIHKEIMELFEIGAIPEDEAIDRMKNFNLSEQEAKFQVYHAKLKLSINRLHERIKYIHNAVVDGRVDLAEGRAALSGLGIQPSRIDEYVSQWQAELQVDLRILTLRQLLTYFVDGAISRDELVGRLQKLKYSDTDINAIMKRADKMLADATAKQEAIATREADRAEKEQEKAQNKLARQIAQQAKAKQQDAQRQAKLVKAEQTQAAKQLSEEQKIARENLKTEQKVLAAGATDKNLQAYWKAGVIDLAGLRMRLAARNFSSDTIEKWIDTYILKGASA